MRRDGVLTGYLWNRNSFGKVKVKGKPTNASKASGRCSRAKCSSCHQQPVSKAKSKTKGRNKRSLSRLLVDDEWAFCKRTPAGCGINAVPYDALDSCHSDTDLSCHDVDDDSYDACDACHADANPMGRVVTDNDLDADDANDDHDISVADGVSDAGMRAPDDVGMLIRAAAHDGYYYAPFTYNVFGMDGILYTRTCPIPVMFPNMVAPDVNPGICAEVNIDVIAVDDDVIHGCHATIAHGEEEEDHDANNSNANQESHAMMVHAAEDVRDDDDDDDDDVYGDKDANDFQSLISGLVHVGGPTRNNDEEALEVECEENSLSGDWCFVSSLDATDDWFLC